jgi:hypothetical protein
MKRDAEAQEKFGQKVADTFHLSDFFIDKTSEVFDLKPTSVVLRDSVESRVWRASLNS